jgi:hypothetical protein
MRAFVGDLHPHDVYAINDPYAGEAGTLPPTSDQWPSLPAQPTPLAPSCLSRAA